MLAGRLPLERIRAREGDGAVVDPDDWAALGETGVFSLTLPEPAGTGLAMADAAVVFEELGRALVPGPLVGTFLAARPGTWCAGRRRAGPGRRCTQLRDRCRPRLVEHLGSLDAAARPPAAARRRRPALITAIGDGAHGAVRVATPLDPLTPLWRLDPLPARRTLDGRRPRPSSSRDGAHPHGGAAGRPRRPRPWTSPWPTPRSASSSASPSAASRPSSTCAPTCWCAPRWPGPRCTPRPAWPMRPTCRRRGGGGGHARRRQVQHRAVAGAKLLADEAAHRQRPDRHPGARRHGLHLGGAAAPAPQAVARARHHLRHARPSLSTAPRPPTPDRTGATPPDDRSLPMTDPALLPPTSSEPSPRATSSTACSSRSSRSRRSTWPTGRRRPARPSSPASHGWPTRRASSTSGCATTPRSRVAWPTPWAPSGTTRRPRSAGWPR